MSCIIAIAILLLSSKVSSHDHDGNCQFDEILEYEIEHEEGFNESLWELEEFYADFNFTEIWEIEEDWDSDFPFTTTDSTSRLINDELFRRRMLQKLKIDTSKFFNGILEIPVIVHVLYNPNYVYNNPYSAIMNGDIVNINDYITNERITSQLLRLNTDLLGLNDEFLPSIWSSLKANFNMTFKLHKIIRKETNIQIFQHSSWTGLLDNTYGGNAVIDRDHYLNLYVAPLGGAWGWASYPNFPAHVDHAAIHWAVFGDNTFNNENNWFFEHSRNYLGKVATHEVGHWLFLRHTFGHNNDAGVCDTDLVDDTPTQGKPNWYCPTTDEDRQDMTKWPKTCDDKIDMWANYMEYTSGICRALFTKGQLERSLSILKLESGKGRATLIDYQKKTTWSEDNKFVNHIYFRVFTELAADKNLICGPTDKLMSDEPINTEISGKFVYGCYTLTSNSYVDIVTDLKIAKNMNEAGDGFSDYCMETNLYKTDDPRYLCYKKGAFNDERRMNVITMEQMRILLEYSTFLPTNSPTPSTNAPTMNTPSPTAVTLSPTSTTHAPTLVTNAPTATTHSPTDATDSPTQNTVSPTPVTRYPTQQTLSPTSTTNSPTMNTPLPTGNTQGPTNNTPSPIDNTFTPWNTTFVTETRTSVVLSQTTEWTD